MVNKIKMNFRVRTILIGITCLFSFIHASAQEPAYWKDVQAFKKQDSAHFPRAGQILFIGSSSFTMWKDVQKYFPAYPILNRGFGGSTLQDQIYYAKDLIVPYKPRQIVIYCGENDLAASDTVTPSIVMKRFEILFYFIRKHYPRTPIAYISMKPSPSRQHLMPKMEEANRLIKHFLAKRSRTSYINVYSKMLKPDGKTPREDLFLEDRLHMNAKGYAIWQKAIAPHLLKK